MKLKTRLFKLFAFIVFVSFLVIVVAYKSRLAAEDENVMAINDTTKKGKKDTLDEVVVVGYSTKHGPVIDPNSKKAKRKDSLAPQKDTGKLKTQPNPAADTTHRH